MGLDDFLKGKKNVTKQEVQDFVQNNRVDVQEVALGTPTESPEIAAKRERFQVLSDKMEREDGLMPQDMAEADKLQQELSAYPNPYLSNKEAKYDKYQLPGGNNYREILLTLPPKQTGASQISFKSSNDVENFLTDMSLTGYEKLDYGRIDDGNVVEFGGSIPSNVMQIVRNNDGDIIAGKSTAGSTYGSSHFEEQNILAHLRVNDRVDADGKKMLLIEEVQSDWHQAGREKGYQRKDLTPDQIELKYIPPNVPEGQNPANYPGYYEAFDKNTGAFVGRHSGSLSQEQAMRDAVSSANQFKTGVPDAPFKDTWYQLALKRALRYATDNGYDRVGLTTGTQQAERYDLSKQISKVKYFDEPNSEKGVLHAYDLEGNNVLSERITKDKIQDYIGKDASKKLLDQSVKENERTGLPSQERTLSGLDLSVGGEGMKKYYDEVYPKFLEKYGKKWGASVGETQIKTGRGVPGGEPVRYIDITPEMRKSVQKGQPLAAVSSESTVA
jgi:hypothetical protein